MNDVEKALSEALNQTGFPFEHFVFTSARAHGWSTRSNRLYIDPEEGKTREMDLLCYRHGKGEEVSTFTSVLVSCKARTGKPWVLLTRPWPERAISWYPFPPVAVWTNDDFLRHEIEKPAWPLDYFNLAEATGLKSWASDSPREVFALQEFEAVSKHHDSRDGAKAAQIRFKARSDSSLYEGTMTLLKALAYEVQAVQQRRGDSKESFVYQFNLIQLLDGDLYEAAFEGAAAPVVKKVERYRYFARTMLNGKDFSARIDFCTRAALPDLLKELSKVHEFNCAHFNARLRTFYETALTTRDGRRVLALELAQRLSALVGLIGETERPTGTDWLQLEVTDTSLKVVASIPEAAVTRLQRNVGFMKYLAGRVEEVCRFEGAVELEWDDIPF